MNYRSEPPRERDGAKLLCRRMANEIDRNLGEQPITKIMADRGLRARDLVAASPEPITHKMVSRACKGRRLTPGVQRKIRAALNAATNNDYSLPDLFNY